MKVSGVEVSVDRDCRYKDPKVDKAARMVCMFHKYERGETPGQVHAGIFIYDVEAARKLGNQLLDAANQLEAFLAEIPALENKTVEGTKT
jgi:hypothetical protein